MRQIQLTPTITDRDNKSTRLYLQEIGKVALLSGEEEAELARCIRQGDRQALERLTKSNLRFVISVAKNFQHRGLPLDELISEGNIGLMKAAERFDGTLGFKFITFAVWWIRQSIMDALAQNARMIRLPSNKVNDITKINKAAAIVEQQINRQPTHEQIADHLGLSVDEVADALAVAPWTDSLDAPMGDEGDFSLLDRIPAGDGTAEPPREEVMRLIQCLCPREKIIIAMMFGLAGAEQASVAKIANEIGVTTARIRQIYNSAIKKLQRSTPRQSIRKDKRIPI